jgi:hypothetical protein
VEEEEEEGDGEEGGGGGGGGGSSCEMCICKENTLWLCLGTDFLLSYVRLPDGLLLPIPVSQLWHYETRATSLIQVYCCTYGICLTCLSELTTPV